jgi:hypothetical protein
VSSGKSEPLQPCSLWSIRLALFDPEDEGSTAYRNDANDLPVGGTLQEILMFGVKLEIKVLDKFVIGRSVPHHTIQIN